MAKLIAPGTLALSLLLAASTATAQEEATSPAEGVRRTVVLVLDLEAIGVDEGQLQIINGTVVDVLSGYEQLEVVSQADIRQMVDLEAEKQAMGCDTTSCLAEIAGAMGAAYVVFGRVGRLDERLFVQLNLFDSAKGRAVARQEVRAERLGEVPDVVRPALAHLVAPLTGIAPPPETPVAAAPDAGSSVLASPLLWGGAAALSVGVVSAVGLGAGTLWADGVLGQLNAPPADKNFAADVGPWLFVGAVTGGALALGGGALVGIAFVGE